MADETTQPQASNGAQAQPSLPQIRPVGQFIRDLSFENVVSSKPIQGQVTPDVSVQVSLDGRKRDGQEGHFEVVTKFKITSKNKGSEDMLFMLELEYGGIFSVSNVPENQLHPFLMIEAPRLLFPYVRRIVADITHDGGFPTLNLEPIDFVALYRQGLAQRQAAAAQNQAQEQPS